MLEGSYDFIVFSSQYIRTNVVLTYFFEYSFLVVCSISSYRFINPPLSLGLQESNVVCINIFNRPS